jgi:hypothetical protein
LSLVGHVPQGIVEFHKGFKAECQQEETRGSHLKY